MHACTKSFLKTTTNSSCVCTHLANKADSDSDSDSDIKQMANLQTSNATTFLRADFTFMILLLSRWFLVDI